MENDELQRYIRILNGKYSEEKTGEMTKQSTNKIGKYTNPIIKEFSLITFAFYRNENELRDLNITDTLLLCGLF